VFLGSRLLANHLEHSAPPRARSQFLGEPRSFHDASPEELIFGREHKLIRQSSLLSRPRSMADVGVAKLEALANG
jgi:hypothetical protein